MTNNNSRCNSHTLVTMVPNYTGILLGIAGTVLNTAVGLAAFKLNNKAQRKVKARRSTLVRSLVRSHTITYLFIIHQSISDAMESSSLMGMNFYLLYGTSGTTILWLVFCIVRQFSMLVSFYQIAFTTVERYLCMIFPLRVPKAFVLKAIAVGIWMFCLFPSIPDTITLTRMFLTSNCPPAYIFVSSLNFPIKRCFIIVVLVPVMSTLLTSLLILKNLRVVKDTKMFTYNNPVKALEGTTSLTKRIAFSTLLQLLILAIFIAFMFTPMSFSHNMVQTSYILLSLHTIVNPCTVVLSYRPIRQTIRGCLGISKKRAYHMRVKYVPDTCFPVALVQYKSYNSTL